MQGSLSVFEEDVAVVRGVVKVQESQVHLLLRGQGLGGQPVRGGQAQTGRILRIGRQKNCHACHQQGVRQLLDDRFQQGS
jgi:hypothetical protein